MRLFSNSPIEEGRCDCAAALRPYGLSPYGSQAKPAAAIARGPSPRFLSLTRNPSLEPPLRFEPTRKAPGDVVL
jgi:hypothetical protein